MKTSLTIALLLNIFSVCIAQTKKFVFYFPSGKQNPANIKAFEDSLMKWRKGQAQIISIKGFADSQGSSKLNKKLSQKRSVKTDSLVRKYIPSGNRYKTEAYGEKFPVASNKTKSGRSKNRRVEVELKFLPPLNDLVEKVEDPKPVPAEKEDTVFVLENGTEIKVKRCALNGLNVSELKIVAKEFLTMDQMILNGMMTRTSNGQCLSTGGMIQYTVKDKYGKTVKLDPACPVDVSIPFKGKQTDFDLYDLKNGTNVQGDSWNIRNEKVRYDSTGKRLKFSVPLSDGWVNCDKLRAPLPAVYSAGNADEILLAEFIKTKRIRDAEVYVNDTSTMLKMIKFAPKKHQTSICNCIPQKDQFVTVYKKKGDKYLFCHKKVSELKIKRVFGVTRYIIKKKEYKVLNSEAEFKAELKAIFAVAKKV